MSALVEMLCFFLSVGTRICSLLGLFFFIISRRWLVETAPSFTLASRTRYTDSVSQDQLLGSTSTSDVDDDCSPLIYNGTLVLHPCGLIANTLFNDIFTVTSGQTMLETDIAWDSDVADKVCKRACFLLGPSIKECWLLFLQCHRLLRGRG